MLGEWQGVEQLCRSPMYKWRQLMMLLNKGALYIVAV